MEKTKTNKKSKSFIVLLVAILLCIAVVLGMGGFTYAKYISQKSVPSQTANVAKWGWTVSAETSELFGTQYVNNKITTGKEASALDVMASSTTTTNVVAPGTSGSMTFSISGSAEVRSKIVISATEGTTVQLKWTDSENTEQTYEPIKWTVTKDSGTTNLLSDNTYASLISYLNTLTSGETGVTVNPTELFTNAGTYKISWEWKFEESDTNNGYDTILGEISNGSTAYSDTYTASTTVTLDLKISVAQVQGTAA